MRNLFWGISFVLIGGLLLLDNLGVASFSDVFHDYWPVLLIIWGGAILFRKRTSPVPPPPAGAPPADVPSQGVPPLSPPQPLPFPGTAEPASQISGDLIHQSQVFGDIYNRVTSQSFKGGSVSTVFGD